MAEFTLTAQCRHDGIPVEQNYKFSDSRRFDLDIAIPELRIGVEIQGGVFTGKAHGSISGILRDQDKSNLLAMLGWRVLKYLPEEVLNGTALEGLKELIRCVMSTDRK